MRTRSAVLALLLGALVALGVPVLASAAPHHNHGLTINATPNPIDAGQGVLIYGQLSGTGSAGQNIYLYHRIAGAPRFTIIGVTKTDQFGFYKFTRQEGVVMTNRAWFVRGPSSSHSRTIHELVTALVSLHANRTSTVTGHRVVFGGLVTPRHAFERVLLQEQESSNGDEWRTIGSTFTNRHSHFALSHLWRRPGEKTVRALFVGDHRNVAGGSDSLTILVMQRERPAFTLTSSQPVIAEGQSATLSGTLDKAGTKTPEPGTKVTLLGQSPNGKVQVVGSTQTASDGTYSFTVAPTFNTTYWARAPKGRRTAPVNQGVHDVVTITSSSSTSQAGGSVVLSGTVSPNKIGHVIFLQRLGKDGAWHDVAHTNVAAGSAYSFTYTFGQDGTMKLRAKIYGGPWNVGGASPVETIIVSGVAPLG